MNADSQRLLEHIRRLAGDPSGTPSDGELLRLYLERRDQAAFAALVRRHGPMVYSVCQSVLRQCDDAEDAFQAAFLILAQKAGSIRRLEGLGGWLQRVAYRVALKARKDNCRRQQREATRARSAPAELSGDEFSWSELRVILHEELAALPEQFRVPLVLCYLEGLTQEEAAQRLGWTAARVKGRLQRGREKLRRRLERRGVALAAALAATLTGQTLAETSVRMGPSFTAETATKAAVVLAHRFLHPLVPMKLAVWSVAFLSVAAGGGGLALHLQQFASDEVLSVADYSADKAATPRLAVDSYGDPLPVGAIARLGTVRFNHGQRLNHVLFSPDGKTIYSEGGGWLRVWDAATGAEQGSLASSEHFLRSLVLTPDGKQIISLDQEFNDVVRVWDLTQLKEIRKLPLPVRRAEQSLTRRNALSRDGRLAAVNLPTEMRIFDLTTGRELHKLAKGGKEIRDVVFAGNDRLVTADAQQIIDVWDARTGKLIRRIAHGAPVQVLAASPVGRWLATLEHHTYAIDRLLDADMVRIWDLNTGERKHTLTARPKRWFMNLYFSPDGKRLVASSYGSQKSELTVWDVATGERTREIGDAYGRTIAVSADGSRLASGLKLWDLKTGHCLSRDESRDAQASALAFSPSGDRVVLIGSISLSTWETTTGRRKSSLDLPPHNFRPPLPALSSDGRYAISFSGDWEKYQTFIWNVAKHRRSFSLKDISCWTGAFSPNSSLVAIWQTGKGPVIRLLEVATGREVRSFPASNRAFPYLSFTDDGKTLLTAGEQIMGYDVSSGKELFSWRMNPVADNSGMGIIVGGKKADPNSRRAWRGITASGDGARIAVTLDSGFGHQPLRDRIALFDARKGKLVRRWSDSGKPSSNYEQLCFSRDGQLLASSDEEVIHVWETATGREIRTLRGHRGDIEFLAFSHDDRLLASASLDGTVLVWDTTGPLGRLTTDAALERSWQALAGDDARHAHDAIGALARTPEKAVALLEDRLGPVQGVSGAELERLIKDLDSDLFAVRQRATKKLQKYGELAELALRRTLDNKPTLEQRRRIEPLLAQLESAIPSGDILRSLRAVRVLEQAGTAEARRLLRELAGGAEGASLTREAQAALTRLNRSPSREMP